MPEYRPRQRQVLNKKYNRESQTTLNRESVLAALATNPHATKRDLARTLGVIGNDRIALKRILKELEAGGKINKIERGKK